MNSMLTKDRNAIFTFKEVCEYLKISKDTLYKYTQKKKIPSFKMGKQLRFKKSSIDKWISEMEKIKKREK